MILYAIFDRYSRESNDPHIEDIYKIVSSKEKAEELVHEENKKCGGGIDYEEINVTLILE